MDGLWEIVACKVATLNRKAKSRLILMIEPENDVHIGEKNRAKGVWDKLKAAFEDSGFYRRVYLFRTLISTRLDDCKNTALLQMHTS